jgi:DUF1680 family protein
MIAGRIRSPSTVRTACTCTAKATLLADLGSPIVALEGMARLASATSWEGVLYRPVVQAEKTVNIRLIPYYAWGNRGKGEMTVWMPLAR